MRTTYAIACLLVLMTTGPSGAEGEVVPGPIDLAIDADLVLDLAYPEPVPISTIAADLEQALGISVVLEPNLRDHDLSLDLRGLSPAAALRVFGAAARVFFKVLAPNAVLMAADTPMNRRSYEEMGIRVFYLRHAEVKVVMTALRSLIGTKALAAHESHGALVVRDSAVNLAVTARLIEELDVASGSAELAASFYEVDREAIERWLQGDGRRSGGQLDRAGLELLVQNGNGRMLAAPTLGIEGGGSARFVGTVDVAGGSKDDGTELGLTVASAPSDGTSKAVFRVRVTTATADLESDVALTAGGGYRLVRPGAVAGATGAREVVLFLGLVSFEPPSYAKSPPGTVWVGTEAAMVAPVPSSQPAVVPRLRPRQK